MLQRLPTIDALYEKGILIVENEAGCMHCSAALENATYLFLLCPIAWHTCVSVLKWFGFVFPIPETVCQLSVQITLGTGKLYHRHLLGHIF